MSIVYSYLNKLKRQELRRSIPGSIQGRISRGGVRGLRRPAIAAGAVVGLGCVLLGGLFLLGPWQPGPGPVAEQRTGRGEQELRRRLEAAAKPEGGEQNATERASQKREQRSGGVRTPREPPRVASKNREEASAENIRALREEVQAMLASRGEPGTPEASRASGRTGEGLNQADKPVDGKSEVASREEGARSGEESPSESGGEDGDFSAKDHFLSRVRTNKAVRELQAEIRASLSSGEFHRAGRALERIAAKLGRSSPFVLKWRGVLALKKQSYARAEEYFLRVVSRSPEDVSARVNLVLALLGQGKKGAARARIRELKEDYPEREAVRKLERMAGS